MKAAWTEDAWQDYLHWQTQDEKMLASISALITGIKRDPFKGLGKPELLKHVLQGWRSRAFRPNTGLVYEVPPASHLPSGRRQQHANRDRYAYGI